ncbi:DUF4062 domain-containing protein [Desulfomicrobium baculatum]|uniref:DUF4062 domain-containing protein n=1 Tax=Desulfomicrobium baculatum (strain DSM 4028 / VKM B-1378 / X) TaxID=525897 RepID=C7LTR1_DESBD|nr:DUF4062 domain-containing protein [Desulfomicrobium baculatum]ACU88346.1 conserved hypothetical protein [Desulfomicrobium baculatum DSM 4028]
MPKGYAPAVFVSSTCFDLGQVRADLAEFLVTLGLDPIISEYASFPVNPNYDAIANCLETVKTRADIFVLIVGARYGQTPREGKSVTNLEYLEARAKGIPIYVFVNKSVLSFMEVWKKNPDGDYTGIVDSTSVFEFIEALRGNAEHWVFPFEKAREVTHTLKAQLAYLFMDGLASRSRIRSVALPDDLQTLSPRALEILLQKPTGWEYLLFAEVFRESVRALRNRRYDYDYGLNFASSISINEMGPLMNWLSTHTDGMVRVSDSLIRLMNQALPVAFGAPGEPGDPSHLVYIAKSLGAAYAKAIEWGLEFQRIHTDDAYSRLMQITSGMTKNIISEIEEFAEHVHSQLNTAFAREIPEGEIVRLELTLTLTAPDMSEFNAEMERLQGEIC